MLGLMMHIVLQVAGCYLGLHSVLRRSAHVDVHGPGRHPAGRLQPSVDQTLVGGSGYRLRHHRVPGVHSVEEGT